MQKYMDKEVFLIINCRHLNIIKEIKEKLLEYEIKLNIFKKDDEFKKLLATDTIVILDNELLLDYGYLKHIESLVRMKRAVHLYKLKEVDLNDLSLFFNIEQVNMNDYIVNNYDCLIKLILSLKTFQIKYYHQNINVDKMYSKDQNFISLIEFYLKNKITDKNYLNELLPLSSNEFEYSYRLMERLLIPKMTLLQMSEMLPFIYHQVFKKKRYELKFNNVVNEIYYEKEYLELMLSNISLEEFNNEYLSYLNAVKQRSSINNTFTTILHKLEVIRIVDGEIRNVLSEKEIKKIKHFLEDKFIKKETINQTIIKDNIYLNYLSDIKVKSFLDFHKKQQHNIIDNILYADIVITLITKKALLNNEFITNIKLSIELNKKVLFIYLDKCNLSTSLQYLIGFSDTMCYWAYNRIDTFFDKYKAKIIYISNNEIKEIRSNIVKLK